MHVILIIGLIIHSCMIIRFCSLIDGIDVFVVGRGLVSRVVEGKIIVGMRKYLGLLGQTHIL